MFVTLDSLVRVWILGEGREGRGGGRGRAEGKVLEKQTLHTNIVLSFWVDKGGK